LLQAGVVWPFGAPPSPFGAVDRFLSEALVSLRASDPLASRLRSDEEVCRMAAPDRAPRTDRSPWNWLLILPIVLPLLTPLFNFDTPRLWGFPAFYWLQFAFILVGVVTTSVVYRMTRTRSGGTDE
jgi:hypothetical protein